MMVPGAQAPSGGLTGPAAEVPDTNAIKLINYLHRVAGYSDVEIDTVFMDHCYARPWNWRPENIYVKPTKRIFFPKNHETNGEKTVDEIDVENDPESVDHDIPCDFSRLRQSMEELQRLANFARPEDDDDWEENLSKTGWTRVQNRLFSRVIRVLEAERLTRLAKTSTLIEPIHRRTSIDSASRRFREVLASSGWDWKLIQWLHILLFDKLPRDFLAIYLDILQNLRTKIPQLIDRMIAVQPNLGSKTNAITWETLGSLLKRTWDPLASCLSLNRPKKLPGNPILIIAPSGFGNVVSSRQQKWISQLGSLGMVVQAHSHLGAAANRMTMMSCMDQLVQTTRAKIQDVRSDFPGRPMILIGFNTGAALACQVAQLEHVTAVVCLGFPFLTVEGKRGTPDDMLMDIRCPVMFVIGQKSSLVKVDDIEDIREKMLVETSLIIVGSADDHIRVSTNKKILEGVTQSMVDRCIVDEIGDFVGGILLQPHPLPLRPAGFGVAQKKEGRKRRNSTSSSVDSESNSPGMSKRSRPVTPVEKGQIVVGNSRQGTLTTQATLVSLGTQNSTTNAPKRKPRLSASQKAEQIARQAAQMASNSKNGGITLNIGTLASLAPIGPLRLNPNAGTQAGGAVGRGISVSRSPLTFGKNQKLMQSGIVSGAGGKKSPIGSSVGKGVARGIGPVEKDSKMITASGASGSQMKIAPLSTLAGTQNKAVGTASGSLNAQLHNRKGQTNQSGNLPTGRPGSTPTILVASSGASATPTVSTTATSTSIAKEMDAMNQVNGPVSPRDLPECTPTSNATPVTVLPSPAKKKSPQSSITKITVNNLQKTPWPSPQELDNELSNILDIPIIIAKDDESIKSIEKAPPPPLTISNSVSRETSDKSVEKVLPTKVVLLSNKEDKLSRPKVQETFKNINHMILQTRPQNSSTTTTITGLNWRNQSSSNLLNASKSNQPTIKYTKIILAKRNSMNSNSSGEPVILTKNPKFSTKPLYTQPKNEHKYAQVSVKIPPKVGGKDISGSETLKIEQKGLTVDLLGGKTAGNTEVNQVSKKEDVLLEQMQ